MATMREVAELAGVSIATVSFVLNDTKPVSTATRQRIEQAMAELGFTRNAVARALASRRTRIIALAYPAMEHRLAGSAMEFVTSAASTARERGYHLVLWPVGNDGRELTELVGQGLVDGVLLMEVQLQDARVDALQKLGLPFALIGRTAEPDGLVYVDIDFETTMEQAVGHLAGLGHRSIVLISGSQTEASFDSYGPYVRGEQAYTAAARRRGLDPVIMVCDQDAAAGRKMAERLRAERPDSTAAVLLNEFAAIGFVSGLWRLGVRVPDELSVVSAISSAEMASIIDPPLTIMRAPGRELGRLGMAALIQRLESATVSAPTLIPCPLVSGASTAAVRSAEPRADSSASASRTRSRGRRRPAS
ncbi:MAG: LacI family DNA-binding transcriptional regulator [Propionibacteriaceae bacterium]